MALNLNEYIKMSYERPNRKVLEGLGASEDLIEYLMETPGNTNWNVVNAIQGSGEDVGEVWFTGIAEGSESGTQKVALTPTDKADTTISLTGYDIIINGVQLSYFTDTSDEEISSGVWMNTPDDLTSTYGFMYEFAPSESYYVAACIIPADFIGEVTVTVSHK